MQGYCEDYVTFVMERLAESKAHTPHAKLYVEQRLKFDKWVPGGFGTGDAGIGTDYIFKGIDLKYGKGVEVDVVDNDQMKIYALGWLELFEGVYDITMVEVTIYQPRLDNIATWSISVEDLLAWAETYLKPKAALAWAGEGDYIAGEHCRFCKARATCRAVAEYNMTLASKDFDYLTEAECRSEKPAELTPEEISFIVQRGSVFVNWMQAVQEYAYDQAVKTGIKWPDLKIVEGRSNRQLIEPDKVRRELEKLGLQPKDYMKPPTMVGVTEMEKLVGGAKVFMRSFGHLIRKPPGKPVLVPKSDPRPEIGSTQTAVAEFEDLLY